MLELGKQFCFEWVPKKLHLYFIHPCFEKIDADVKMIHKYLQIFDKIEKFIKKYFVCAVGKLDWFKTIENKFGAKWQSLNSLSIFCLQ